MKRSWFRRSGLLLGLVVLPGACLAAAAEKADESRPASTQPAAAPKLPEGWKLLYSQTFDKPESIGDFEFTSPEKWKWTALDAGGCMESFGAGKYKTKVRSPLVIGLIRGRVFEDFILDVDLQQTGKEYGHRDMCLFLAFTDPSKYYYVHMATKADKNAHNVFIVNDKPRTNIAKKTTQGIDWGKGVWHHVRLERRGSDGTIRAFFDDMTTPIMEANDKTFPAGCVGFGTFDDVGRVDNVRIWGPKVVQKQQTFFPKAGEEDRKEAKPAKRASKPQ